MSKKHKKHHRGSDGRFAPAKPAVLSSNQIFYWAYGSNLNIRQMARRCPDAVKHDVMNVTDCALVFRGVADVTKREGYTTPGGLWAITPRCEASLDQYEGVAQKLYLKRYFVLKVDGRPRTCLFYQMRTKEGILPPSEEYLATIAKGYEDFGLDKTALNVALEEAWGNKDVTELMLERHLRRGRPRLARSLEHLPARRALPAPMWGDEHDEHGRKI